MDKTAFCKVAVIICRIIGFPVQHRISRDNSKILHLTSWQQLENFFNYFALSVGAEE